MPGARDRVEAHAGREGGKSLARHAPDGLAAQLVDGHAPDWLELVEPTAGKSIEIYKVR